MGLVKLRSYATVTSPEDVKLAGREVVTAVSETEKMLELESSMFNRLPVVVPLAPIFKLNKSPVAVVAEPGVQSILTREPVPAAPVSPVEVVVKSRSLPEVKVLAGTDSWTSLPIDMPVDPK